MHVIERGAHLTRKALDVHDGQGQVRAKMQEVLVNSMRKDVEGKIQNIALKAVPHRNPEPQI